VEIRGSSALVTGAGRGIGRSIAKALAAEGARVTAVARTESDLVSLVREIEAAGGRAAFLAGDLRERAACDAAVARAVEAHGGLQILVNNAGIGGRAPVAEMKDEAWDDILGTNLTAVFRLTGPRSPISPARAGTSSWSRRWPVQRHRGMAAYCASKAALDHFARCLMLEVRHQGVKVTTLAPGSVDTGFGGRGERPAEGRSWMLRPEDVAGAVVDLLRTRDDAHLSRVEMRPLRPQQRA
jgi:NAD(P)-dependent dehydrogenase (short-subunit alcohol dehydrogenase family)